MRNLFLSILVCLVGCSSEDPTTMTSGGTGSSSGEDSGSTGGTSTGNNTSTTSTTSSSSTSTTSSTSTSSTTTTGSSGGSGSTGGVGKGDYQDCGPDGVDFCPPKGTCIHTFGGPFGFCSEACLDVSDCPASNFEVVCLKLGLDPDKNCALRCETDSECPDGWSCLELYETVGEPPPGSICFPV